MNILVVVAHPDDEVLGVGGTIQKHIKKNDKVRIIYLATGITSRKSQDNENKHVYTTKMSKNMKDKIIKLRNNSKQACRILGVDNLKFYSFPDNEMDSIPLLKIIKTIEKEIDEFKPNRIYTHHQYDLNVDHQIAYKAVLTACRPISKKNPDIFSFEVPSSTDWNFPKRFHPNYFVNIEKYVDKKIKSMEKYENEIRVFPHPRSSKYIKINAERWGSICGKKAAEVFEIIRITKD